jgi:hypothetical protein
MKSAEMGAYLDRCRTIIAARGHLVQAVMTQPYGYCYTVGLTPALGAELLVIGLPQQMAGGFLNDLAGRLRERPIPDGERITDLANLPFKLVTHEVAGNAHWPRVVTMAFGLGFAPTRLRQLLWPDPQGRFPDDPAYAFGVPQTLEALVGLA